MAGLPALSRAQARPTANPSNSLTIDVNERILQKCHSLYTAKDVGLLNIGSSVGLPLLAPRKKITVMLMGNHSAGKSAFINWYIEEHIQKTGVAIETQGFSFVTSGQKRESLTGNATLHLYPHFQPLQEIKGVTDYLSTEISASKMKKFSMVTFIDTPGLVDGDMQYPFDVNQALLWIGDLCDLVLVFFDPIGQALCRRTLDVVELLYAKHPDRIHFFLSKADEAGSETDRQKVMMQIVQELCKRPGLNKPCFDMPTIYLPNPNKIVRCTNQIEEVCLVIEKTIEHTVQNTLNALESDCQNIESLIDTTLKLDDEARQFNFKNKVRATLFSMTGLLVPVLLMFVVFLGSAPANVIQSFFGASNAVSFSNFFSPFIEFWRSLDENTKLWFLAACLAGSGFCLLMSRVLGVRKPCLQHKNKLALFEKRRYVSTVIDKKQSMYEEYLRQYVSEHDL